MPRFILEIEMGNDAMVNEHDIAGALTSISNELIAMGLLYHETYNIRDINGNTVGHYEVIP